MSDGRIGTWEGDLCGVFFGGGVFVGGSEDFYSQREIGVGRWVGMEPLLPQMAGFCQMERPRALDFLSRCSSLCSAVLCSAVLCCAVLLRTSSSHWGIPYQAGVEISGRGWEDGIGISILEGCDR